MDQKITNRFNTNQVSNLEAIIAHDDQLLNLMPKIKQIKIGLGYRRAQNLMNQNPNPAEKLAQVMLINAVRIESAL